MYNDKFNISIEPVSGHYEAYINDEFFCSGDSYKECEDDVKEYLNSLEEKE